MTEATIFKVHYGPLKVALNKKTFESQFPACEYEKHISEDYSPPGFFIICGVKSKNNIIKLAFLTHLNDRIKIISVDGNKLNDKSENTQKFSKVQRFRKEISLNLKIDDDSLHDETGENLKKPVPFGRRPRWQIYSADGQHRYHDINLLVASCIENPSGTSLLYTGGVFFWPGVKIGHERLVSGIQGFENVGDKQLRLITLSLRPLVFEIYNFITTEECDHLISKSKHHLGDSVVSKMDGDEDKSDTTWRTSKTYFMPKGHTDILKMLERRVRDITRIPLSHAESAQILRYSKTGHYYTHHDYFDPRSYQNSQNTLHLVENGAKNRLATVFWYMSDVKSGGETNFPRFDGAPPPSDTKTCYTGLKVKPRKGKVIIFHNMLPNGDLDPLSLHAGCSVGEGEKWSANKWIWNKPYSRHGWNGDDIDLIKETNIDLHVTKGEIYTEENHHGSNSYYFQTILSDGDMMVFNKNGYVATIVVISIVVLCMCWRFVYYGKLSNSNFKNKKNKL